MGNIFWPKILRGLGCVRALGRQDVGNTLWLVDSYILLETFRNFRRLTFQ
jgi:hypothetical protein